MEVERGLRHDSGGGTFNASQLNSNEEASSAEDNKELKDGGTVTFVPKKLEPTGQWKVERHRSRCLKFSCQSEEKLRTLYDNQHRRLKILDDRGSESENIDDTMASMRRLHPEISVAVASITVISREIHKLLPELKRLIEGYATFDGFTLIYH
ncbi:hypothetical protein L6164_014994 [Bauhinia variegata]|uniref:Uncharacterized protein n=1 Tax=Bauhinia variegata TaxID=167791 RepID=A0ACB9NJV4_BAUVA|nr:hypothetical protein L6164_014994 [Bauhinia variegata]